MQPHYFAGQGKLTLPHWGSGNLCAEKHDADQNFEQSACRGITIAPEASGTTVIKVSYPVQVLTETP